MKLSNIYFKEFTLKEFCDKIEKQGLQSEVFKGVVPIADWGISGVLEEFPNSHEVLKN